MGSITAMGPTQLRADRAIIVAVVAVAVVAAADIALAAGLSSRPSSQVATVPADGHASATLELVSGTRLLSLRVANLGGTSGTLLRAATPRGAAAPRVRVAGTDGTPRSGDNELVLVSASSGAGPVTVTLNAAVTWRLDFAAGTERTVASLRGGRVAGITVTAGSRQGSTSTRRPGRRACPSPGAAADGQAAERYRSGREHVSPPWHRADRSRLPRAARPRTDGR